MRLLTVEKLDKILVGEGFAIPLPILEEITKDINVFMSAPGIYQMPESTLTKDKNENR